MSISRFVFGIAAGAVLLFGAPSAREVIVAQDQTASAETGSVTSNVAAESRDMADAPDITAQPIGQPRAVPPPRSGVPEAVYRGRKQASAIASNAPGGAIGEAPTLLPGGAGDVGILTPGATRSFEGLNQGQCGFIPSDHGIGVGTQFIVQALNGCVLVLDKNTGAIPVGWPKSLNAFFGAPAGAFIFDPRVLYDKGHNRYIVIAEEWTGTFGFVRIAISRTASPTGLWWFYTVGVPTTVANDFPDFPTLGVDKEIIYVCTTVFKAAGGIDDVCQFLPKVKMINGQAIGAFFFAFNFNVGGVRLDSIQPANVGAFSKDFPRAGFLVASRNINFGGGQCAAGCNGIVVYAVSNALLVAGSPGIVITGVNVPTANNYIFPPNALQPGCGSPSSLCAIDTLDTRITGQVTYTNGSLWASLNTKRSGNNTSTVLWFQIRPFLNDGNAACTGSFLNKCAQLTGAELLNEDCYFCGGRGNSGSDWNAVPVSNSEGDVTMVASYSDLSYFPGVFYVSRRVTQAKNTMHDAGIFLAVGQAFYQRLDQFNRNRWGDYSAAQIDNLDQMYFAAQYSGAGNIWRTRIGRNAFTARNQP